MNTDPSGMYCRTLNDFNSQVQCVVQLCGQNPAAAEACIAALAVTPTVAVAALPIILGGGLVAGGLLTARELSRIEAQVYQYTAGLSNAYLQNTLLPQVSAYNQAQLRNAAMANNPFNTPEFRAFAQRQASAQQLAEICNSGWCLAGDLVGQLIGVGSFASFLTNIIIGIYTVNAPSISIYDYRLSGFDQKVGSLAEHLAKVLDREIAGYPRPDPNPENRATRVWCVTIRRVIQEIDNAGYSERQLNRDLEAAGISSDTWNIIKEAVRAAVEICEDHWGDFTGGSLATG